jgi:tetratricopeptide (TPR) repeat protein
VVFNLFIGASIAHIDNFAHLGGLLFGLFAGLLLSRTLTAQAETRVRVQGIIFVLLAAMLFGGWRYVERRNSFAAPLARGMEATQHNDLKTATQAFAQAAALRPDIADLHYLLAHTYVAQQQFDKAVPELQRALALEPRQSLAQFDLCYSQLQLKQYEDAVNACAAAAKLNPANISAAINESAALLNLGRYADAIQLLEAWQAKAPNVAEIHMNLGKAYLESGKYGEAVAQYQQAVNLAPKNPAALESLSRAKQKARQ